MHKRRRSQQDFTVYAPVLENLSDVETAVPCRAESILNSWRKPRLLRRLEAARGLHSVLLWRSRVRNPQSCGILLGKPYQSVCTHAQRAERVHPGPWNASFTGMQPQRCNGSSETFPAGNRPLHRHAARNPNVFTVMFTLAIVFLDNPICHRLVHPFTSPPELFHGHDGEGFCRVSEISYNCVAERG